MPLKKRIEDKVEVKRFKDRSSHFWVSNHHYYLDENNEIQYACGGVDTQELREALKSFIKRNRVVHTPREPSVLEQIEKEFTSVFFRGKYKGLKLQDIFYQDIKYVQWMLESYTFSAEEQKLKEEITEILKK